MKKLIPLLFIAVLLFACKKKDTTQPSAPSSTTTAASQDTLFVYGTITGNIIPWDDNVTIYRNGTLISSGTLTMEATVKYNKHDSLVIFYQIGGGGLSSQKDTSTLTLSRSIALSTVLTKFYTKLDTVSGGNWLSHSISITGSGTKINVLY